MKVDIGWRLKQAPAQRFQREPQAGGEVLEYLKQPYRGDPHIHAGGHGLVISTADVEHMPYNLGGSGG
jgi:hypothetical protein